MTKEAYIEILDRLLGSGRITQEKHDELVGKVQE